MSWASPVLCINPVRANPPIVYHPHPSPVELEDAREEVWSSGSLHSLWLHGAWLAGEFLASRVKVVKDCPSGNGNYLISVSCVLKAKGNHEVPSKG